MNIKEKLLNDLRELKIDNVYIFCRWFSVYYKVNFDNVFRLLEELQKDGLIDDYLIRKYHEEEQEHIEIMRGY